MKLLLWFIKGGKLVRVKTPNDTYNSSTFFRNFSGTGATTVLVVHVNWYLMVLDTRDEKMNKPTDSRI